MKHFGFTLIELLVVISMIALLIGLIMPALGSANHAAKRIACANMIKQVATATTMYMSEHKDHFPRSYHSALAHRQYPWSITLLAYLGQSKIINPSQQQRQAFDAVYRCPSDDRQDESLSIGKNVYTELSPQSTDGQSWAKGHLIPRPSANVFWSDTHFPDASDHLMAHVWDDPIVPSLEIGQQRHASRSQYSFVDGHVKTLTVKETFSLTDNINLWNPKTAR